MTEYLPLAGLRVLEMAGSPPAAHVCMMLADMGADVVRIERPETGRSGDPLLRGRGTIIELSLRDVHDVEALLELIDGVDVLVEGFRPGVAERLGFGPEIAFGRNPGLIYGRITGWGQSGPRAHQAGHDINFLAPTGILHSMGRSDDRPIPPLNLVGGFGGGSMFLATGVLAALFERQRTGLGQVVDVAMAEGASVLAQSLWSLRSRGGWNDERGTNLVDGSCPFIDTYECADARYVAVGAVEPEFFTLLLEALGLDRDSAPDQWDRAQWPRLRELLATEFRRETRDVWAKTFLEVDACVSPVLTFAEAHGDPQFVARGAFDNVDGVVQPAPVPRFQRRRPAPIPVTSRTRT